MSVEIKNRRENIVITKIPPKIIDEETLAADGFVKNTNYPVGSTTAGVVKVSANYGTAVGSGGAVEGVLMGSLRTYAQYNSANNALRISKGTLENVLLSVFGALIRSRIPDETWATLETGTKCNFNIIKLEDGTFNINVDTVAPE